MFFITYRPSICLIQFTRCFIGVDYKKSSFSKALHEWQLFKKTLLNLLQYCFWFLCFGLLTLRHVGS